ncbi:MAG TPA: hypothetical protein VG389_09195 [Myxococcota bacterium]|nr:hypothetical protein [Myxococcota bacterium]
MPVILWNEASRYPMPNMSRAGAWQKDGHFVSPSLSFYVPQREKSSWDPFQFSDEWAPGAKNFLLKGAPPDPYPCERRVRYLNTPPSGERRWVYDTEWLCDHAAYEETVAALRAKVRQFLIHHDVSWDSRGCYSTLQSQRSLAVQFMLDYDGTIYQACDMAHFCWHVGEVSKVAIGVEVNHVCNLVDCHIVRDGKLEPFPRELVIDDKGKARALYDASQPENARCAAAIVDWLKKRGVEPHDLEDGRVYYPVRVHRRARPKGPGRDFSTAGLIWGQAQSGALHYEGLMLDFTPEQHQAIRALARGVVAAVGVRPAVIGLPDNPYLFNFLHGHGTAKGLKARGKFRGVLGHVHVSAKGKFDPNWGMRWRDIAADLSGAAVALPPPPPKTAPMAVTAKHATVVARLVRTIAGTATPEALEALRKEAPRVGPEETLGDATLRDDARAQAEAMIRTVQSALLLLHERGLVTARPDEVTGVVDASTLDALEEFCTVYDFPYKGVLTGPLREYLLSVLRQEGMLPEAPTA